MISIIHCGSEKKWQQVMAARLQKTQVMEL